VNGPVESRRGLELGTPRASGGIRVGTRKEYGENEKEDR
jgi:hypothetical protein